MHMPPDTSGLTSAEARIYALLTWLSRQRLRMSCEKQAQADLEAALIGHDIKHRREAHLTKGDIPDFLVGDIVIELKTKGSAMAIYRQCERYAQHDEVGGVILLTARAMSLPQTIAGKPAAVASMGAAWL